MNVFLILYILVELLSWYVDAGMARPRPRRRPRCIRPNRPPTTGGGGSTASPTTTTEGPSGNGCSDSSECGAGVCVTQTCVCNEGATYHEPTNHCYTGCFGGPECDYHAYCDWDVTYQCVCPNMGDDNVCLPVYTIHEDVSLTWDDAKTYCEGRKGQLAMFKNDREVTMFADLVKTKPYNVYYWIGIKAEDPSTWTFVDGDGFQDQLHYSKGTFFGTELLYFKRDFSNNFLCMAAYNRPGLPYPFVEEKDCSTQYGVICQDIRV